MGIQKCAVQRLIFHSLFNPRLGINISDDSETTFDLCLVDNLSQLHAAACALPGIAGDTPADEVEKRIVGAAVRVYGSAARRARHVILCDDGGTQFKPAVREVRERADQPAASLFVRRNLQGIMVAVFAKLDELGVRYAYLRGRGSRCVPAELFLGRVWREDESAARFRLNEFARCVRSGEADTLVFELLLHLRRAARLPDSVLITTRDSDVVPTAMAVMARFGPLCLGDTVLGFVSNMFNRSTGGRDLPRMINLYGWARWMPEQKGPGSEEARLLEAEGEGDEGVPPLLWDMLYDCEDAQGVFSEAVSGVEQLVLRSGSGWGYLRAAMRGLYTRGGRGPVFRVLMELLAHQEDDYTLVGELDALWAKLASPGYTNKQFEKDFRHLLEHHRVPCSMQSSSQSHVPFLLRVLRMYLRGSFPDRAYGAFLRAVTPDRNVIHLRMHRTKHTIPSVLLCGLSGTDYNLPLVMMGGQKVVDLCGDPEFVTVCEGAWLPESPAANTPSTLSVRRLINAIGVGHHCEESDSELLLLLTRYVTALSQTLGYVLRVWTLDPPEPDPIYGYRSGGFVFPFEQVKERLAKTLTLARASYKFV